METTTAPKVGGVYLADHINQNGITYGQRKLELMQKACRLQGTPLTDENTDQDGNTISPLLSGKAVQSLRFVVLVRSRLGRRGHLLWVCGR